MNIKKINFTVIIEKTGYSAYTSIEKDFIATEGDTVEELIKNILEASNLHFKEKGITISESDIVTKIDISSMLEREENNPILNKIENAKTHFLKFIYGKKEFSYVQTEQMCNLMEQSVGKFNLAI